MTSSPFASQKLVLSRQARSLWGKSDGGEDVCWLPLYMHMLDSAGIAGCLWDEWLPEGTRASLIKVLGNEPHRARGMACFIAGVHDIGKATPSFQGMPCGVGGQTLEYRPRNAGLPICSEAMGHRRASHPNASYLVLLDLLSGVYGWDIRCAKSVAAIVGGHHGKPSAAKDVPMRIREEGLPQAYGLGWDEKSGSSWTLVQEELVALVAQAAGLSQDDLASFAHAFIPAPEASLLTGFVIMADWLASDVGLFPLIANGFNDDGGLDKDRLRIEPISWADVARDAFRAWRRVNLIPAWQKASEPSMSIDDLYRRRFGFSEAMEPRPMQRAAVEVARSVEKPSLMIIEAPMGEGKTEAALAAAEVLAARTGRGGVCVALPTMATTDAMFGRVHSWLEHLPTEGGSDGRSVFLAHGKAKLNEEFQGLARSGRQWAAGSMGEDLEEGPANLCDKLRNQPDSVVVSQWMQGRKKGILANFVVCTVDQVLMGALEMKHLSLRQLALANKVVVIDECHAYDTYMRCYLNRILGWLGAMGVPVVLLSATLPSQQRIEMLRSYRDGQQGSEIPVNNASHKRPRRRSSKLALARVAAEEGPAELSGTSEGFHVEVGAYPLITYTDGAKDINFVAPEPSGRSLEVRIGWLEDNDEALISLVEERLALGGCAGIICTTVTRAQHAAQVLRSAFGNDTVILTHARFVDLDRMANETRLRDLLGPDSTLENGLRPERLIVVGTQVLEQSLDIDFDMMVTDVAPIDLVMQRLGRLHRHKRLRPAGLGEATCYLRGIKSWGNEGPVFADNVSRVYPAATLLEALGVLGLTDEGVSCEVNLPADIARTVRDSYGNKVTLPRAWQERYVREQEKRDDEIKRKRARASACLLRDVGEMLRDGDTLVDWYAPKDLATRDQDYGPRAVRDTGETVEVLALELREGSVHLLPWIGDEAQGVEYGAQVDTAWVPDGATAQLAAQSAVRLPQSLCRPEELEGLIDELEKTCGPYVGSWQDSPWLAGFLVLLLERVRLPQSLCRPEELEGLIDELEKTCGPYVGSWQDSPWLAGFLVLLLERSEDGRLSTVLRGRVVTYSREEGLVAERGEAMM